MSDNPHTPERAPSEEPTPSHPTPSGRHRHRRRTRNSNSINSPLSPHSLLHLPSSPPSFQLQSSDPPQSEQPPSSPPQTSAGPSALPESVLAALESEIGGGHQVGERVLGRLRRGKYKEDLRADSYHQVMVRSTSSGSDDSEHDSDSSYPCVDSQSPTSPGSPEPEKKPKRTRTLTTPHQQAVLHALLAQSRFPTTQMREEVGKAIGMSARKVQIWFQNQRQKARRPRSDSQTDNPVPRPPQYGPYPASSPTGHMPYGLSPLEPTGVAAPLSSILSADVPYMMSPTLPRSHFPQYPSGSPYTLADTSRRSAESQSRHPALPPLVLDSVQSGMYTGPSPLAVSSAGLMNRIGRGVETTISPQSARVMSPAFGRRSHDYSGRPQSPVSGSHRRSGSTTNNIPPPFTLQPEPIWAATNPIPRPTTSSPLSARSRFDPIRSSMSQTPPPPSAGGSNLRRLPKKREPENE